MSETQAKTVKTDGALDRLVNREDVLQICYWCEGEGFGDIFTATTLSPFLNVDIPAIIAALSELETEGLLTSVPNNPTSYSFTDNGRKEGGRLFGDTFHEYSRQGHGECPDGCCDDDDHSQCGDHCTLH